MLRHQNENFHDGIGRVGEDLVVDGFNVVVANLEALVQGQDVVVTSGAEYGLVVVLKNNVGQLRQGQHGAVVGLHHQLNAQPLALILVTQHLSECPLMVKQEAILVAVGNQLQAKAKSPQEGFALQQYLVLFFGQDTEACQIRDILQTEVSLGNPADGLYIPQCAWRAFYIGLKVVFRVPVFRVALLLLFPFCYEVIAVRADGV